MDALEEIQRLDHELESLRRQEAAPDADPALVARIHAIELRLDQVWDLRRRQQAAQALGLPRPSDLRREATVEDYRQ